MIFKKVLLREDKSIYLIRYTLLWLPFLKIRLHKIMLSDNDCLHDHPWDFISIILKGGYYEIKERPHPVPGCLWIDKTFLSPGAIVRRRAEDKHRVALKWDVKKCRYTPSWSLVFMFRRRREWGFWTKAGKFVHHADYTLKQNCE